MTPFSKRRHHENVCDNSPGFRTRTVKVSATIDENTEEMLQVIAEFGDEPHSLSFVLNDILFKHFQDDKIDSELKRAYDRWKRERP